LLCNNSQGFTNNKGVAKKTADVPINTMPFSTVLPLNEIELPILM
jgi:hypothetical protein